MLVLVGSADPISPLRLGKEIADLLPHADLVVQPGAGHYPWLDDPAWFVDRVSRFPSVQSGR